MLNQPTLEKLETLRLHGMAEAFRAQADPAQRDGLAALSFEERFALLVDQEWTWRQNRALSTLATLPTGGAENVESWIADHNLNVDGPVEWKGGRRWIFRPCPWNSNHQD